MIENITKETGLEFLRSHQPMPQPMDEGYSETLDDWVKVFTFFSDNPCEEAIPLFLNSFGEDDGCDMYQTLGPGFLCLFSAETLAPYLIKALNSPSEVTRFWGCVFVMWCDSDDPEFINALINRLSGTRDERGLCLFHLKSLAEDGFFNWREYKDSFEEHFNKETDPRLREYYEDIINNKFDD